MKHIVFIAAVLSLIAFSSCRKHTLYGQGDTITETRSLSDFTEVEANGDVDVVVFPSNTNKVIITSYENLVPVFETNIRNGKLTLQFPDRYYNVRHNNIHIDLYTTSMNSFSLNGSGKTNILQGFPEGDMGLEINGSGDINIGTNKFNTMHCNISGSGSINGRDCVTDNAFIRISGSGNVDLTVLKKLDVHISGSGDVNYWGSPEVVNTDISGSGNVRKKG